MGLKDLGLGLKGFMSRLWVDRLPDLQGLSGLRFGDLRITTKRYFFVVF